MAIKVGTIVRKNGVPVKRFWREKVSAKRRETWQSTYPVYLHGMGFNVGELTGEKAPRTLEEAEHAAKVLVESSDTEWTMAVVYELRALVRYGTTFDHKQYEKEQRTAHANAEEARGTFRLISTTATEGVGN